MLPGLREHAAYAAERRAKISAMYPGKRLILPAGDLKTRSNDTEYPYRAHSAFAHLTGWGGDTVPGSVLVMEPTPRGHDAVLYFRQSAPRGSSEFYANPTIGEFWTGSSAVARARRRRPRHRHPQHRRAAERHRLGGRRNPPGARRRPRPHGPGGRPPTARGGFLAPRRHRGRVGCRRCPRARPQRAAPGQGRLRDRRDARRHRGDPAGLRGCHRATCRGPSRTARGERIVEGTFNRRARADGNAVGYDTIAASGPHACILHWTRNDGPVVPGDLILIDAGVEVDSYYTADITRTLPVDGTFSQVQRRVYEAVREAADAAFAIVRPGIRVPRGARRRDEGHRGEDRRVGAAAGERRGVARAGRASTTAGTWCTAPPTTSASTCTTAPRPAARSTLDGVVQPGMVFTIEPGLYFQPDDLTRARRSTAASGCGSRTTSSSPRPAPRTCRSASRARPTTSRPGCAGDAYSVGAAVSAACAFAVTSGSEMIW